jgi:hypothetical protein
LFAPSFSNEMSKGEHHFYFSSKYSTHNSRGSFTVNLPFSLQFTGQWKCAVIDLFISHNNLQSPTLYLLSDFCDTSLVHEGKQLPILRKVYLENNTEKYSFTNLVYISLKQNHISNFTLSFLNIDLQPIVFDNNTLIECVIHFLKDE